MEVNELKISLYDQQENYCHTLKMENCHDANFVVIDGKVVNMTTYHFQRSQSLFSSYIGHRHRETYRSSDIGW